MSDGWRLSRYDDRKVIKDGQIPLLLSEGSRTVYYICLASVCLNTDSITEYAEMMNLFCAMRDLLNQITGLQSSPTEPFVVPFWSLFANRSVIMSYYVSLSLLCSSRPSPITHLNLTAKHAHLLHASHSSLLRPS